MSFGIVLFRARTKKSSGCEDSTKSSWRQRYEPVCTKYTSVFGMCSVRTLVFSRYVFGNTSGHSGKLYSDHLQKSKTVCTRLHTRYLHSIITPCMAYVHTHTKKNTCVFVCIKVKVPPNVPCSTGTLVHLYTFLNSEVEWKCGQRQAPADLPPGKSTGPQSARGWVSTTVAFDGSG